MTTSVSEYPLARSGPSAGRRFFRPAPPIRVLLAAAASVAALALLFAAEPSGTALRGDLSAAATRLRALPATASRARVDAELRREFADRDATIDAAEFPAAVTVTLHGLDRPTCAAALGAARRLEGRVVVELEGYGTAAQCGTSNEMRWRFMP